MTLKHYQKDNIHYIIDDEILKILVDNGLDNQIRRFSIACSKKYRFENNLHIVDNFATDGEKLIIFERGWQLTPTKTRKILSEISELPISYPNIVFYGDTIGTFLKLGKLTFYANITKKNVTLHIPGGEVNLPRKIIGKIKVNSYTDLFPIIYEYGGSMNTRLYSRHAYKKATEEFDNLTIVPYFDIIILISDKFVYRYDGEQTGVYYPFKLEEDIIEFLEAVPLEQAIFTLIMI